MHQSSYEKMQGFRDRHLAGREAEALRIVDLGSQDVNGSYRELFSGCAWTYVGADASAGRNVDVVLADPDNWRELSSRSADVLISGQALEHMPHPWIAMLEIRRVLVPGGLCCLLAPAGGPEHRYPVDCWRILSDGFAALADWADLEVVELATQWENRGHADGSDVWHDSLFVGRCPQRGGLASRRAGLRRWLKHRVLTWRNL